MDSKFNDKSSLILVCPVCGYSFKSDVKGPNKQIFCPMCGFKFQTNNLNPNEQEKGPKKHFF